MEKPNLSTQHLNFQGFEGVMIGKNMIYQEITSNHVKLITEPVDIIIQRKERDQNNVKT